MNKYTLTLAFGLFLLSILELSRGCRLNEQFTECFNPCNTCRLIGVHCSIICESGCDCIQGHRRNKFGVCIPEHLCGTSKTPEEGREDIVQERPCDTRACSRRCHPRPWACNGPRCICLNR
ncbi:hypothetical protein TNCT_251001 [Trichonephila clavata]|uniref:TIL domain-containing protein n=1 Tax=Trichonephila clavata TaxID=2740835 RepID=A0A8X6LZG3_TRICU|nr:hypothetical protein TNCT_251001 [Trichonephila clavata]